MMANTDSVVINGRTFKLDGGDCKSRNVIYLFLCQECFKPYVGKTDMVLHRRNNGHRNCEPFDNADVITDFQALRYHSQVFHKTPFQDLY